MPGRGSVSSEYPNKGQIELISCTYSPQMWITFPKIDLKKSIELNQELLNSYKIKSSRIFFSQENFSGEGVKYLSEWFDVAIIKDDYYFYLYDKPHDMSNFPPYFNLDDIKVMVGGGHILEGMAQDLFSKKELNSYDDILKRKNFQYLNSAYINRNNGEKLNNFIGKYKDIEWKWYHMGSSERFGKAHMRPEIAATCMFDPDWHSYAERHLMELESLGYIFTGVQSFLDALENVYDEVVPCKTLLDGSWNMARSKGGYIWCGFNSSKYEDDLMIRNQNWKSRARLIGLEALLQIFPNEITQISGVENRVKNAWKHQLMAEICDSTGWFPSPYEVEFSLNQSDVVFKEVSHVVNSLKLATSIGGFIVDTKDNSLLASHKDSVDDLKKILKSKCFVNPIKLFGANGTVNFYEIGEGIQRIITDFIPTKDCCGIKFNYNVDYLLFSPALMENEVIKVSLADLKPEKVYLPLPNGLICIQKNLYLIKHNEFMSISACINRKSMKLTFEIANPHKYNIHWELTLFKGDLNSAIDMAKKINITPIVHLVIVIK